MKRYICFLMALAVQTLSAGQSYYVNNLNSGGDGSFNNPYSTIAKGLSVLKAGDTLFIRGSASGEAQVYQENINLGSSSVSGSESANITVKNYGKEQVRILLSASFSVYSDWWFFEGLVFDIGANNYDLIKVRGDHLTFRNCEVTNGQKDGFDITNANYLLVENCRIHNFNRSDATDAHGIILDGGQNNTFRNNVIYDCKGDCIQLYRTYQNYNTVIEGNDLYTTFGPGSENAIDCKDTHGCIIRNNKMHGFHKAEDSDGVALKMNYDSDDVLIEGNDIYESNGGFRISGGETDRIVFQRNAVHDLHADGGDVSKYGYGIQFDGVNDIQVVSNTFANLPGPLFWIASAAATNLTMKNNLFYKANKLKDDGAFQGSVSIDYNGWFQCAETIGGAHDVTGSDPKFKDEANRDYYLLKESPVIDKGDLASGSGYPGGRIDLGAFEFEPSTSLQQGSWQPPQGFQLYQNFPNPFNPETTIAYELPAAGQVSLTIYDLQGRKVSAPVNSQQKAGFHRLEFSAVADKHTLTSGVYLYVLKYDEQQAIKRMILLK